MYKILITIYYVVGLSIIICKITPKNTVLDSLERLNQASYNRYANTEVNILLTRAIIKQAHTLTKIATRIILG
jgi:hypothetical protein